MKTAMTFPVLAETSAAHLRPEPARVALLQLSLRVVSVGMLAAFVPWITLILTDAPLLAPGGALAALLRFRPFNPSYETMLATIHLVWAVMLWRASRDPERHILFVDFTIWANAVHGVVMVVVTPLHKGALMMAFESLPLLGIAAVLASLRPRPRASE